MPKAHRAEGRRTDVLIVGGGLCGLAVAHRLGQGGASVLLAEARPRLGGRIHTIEPHGLDGGPAWFWPGQPRVARLAQDLGLRVFSQHAAGRTVFENGGGAVRRDLELSLNPEALRIAGGMARLIDGLAAAAPADRLLLGHQVTEITRPDADLGDPMLRARLTGPVATRTVQARVVVVAAPPRVAARDIHFAPALPRAARSALETIPTWMAGRAKLLAVYERPFWRDDGLSGDAISHSGPLAQIHDASPLGSGPGALFGFVGVGAGARAQLGRGALQSRAIAQLTRLFGPAAAAPHAVSLIDWAKEPFTATTDDAAAPSAHPAYGPSPALSALAKDGLIFASTELAPEHGGFVEGALAAAAQAAGLAQAQLRRPAPALGRPAP